MKTVFLLDTTASITEEPFLHIIRPFVQRRQIILFIRAPKFSQLGHVFQKTASFNHCFFVHVRPIESRQATSPPLVTKINCVLR